jgi:hypothetical protein
MKWERMGPPLQTHRRATIGASAPRSVDQRFARNS